MLIAIGAVGTALAGFSGIAAAFSESSQTWTPLMRLRVRLIVVTGLAVVFESLLPLILVANMSDVRVSFGLASVASDVYVAVAISRRLHQRTRMGPVTKTTAISFLTMVGALVLFAVDGVAWQSLGPYSAALTLQLAAGAISFQAIFPSLERN